VASWRGPSPSSTRAAARQRQAPAMRAAPPRPARRPMARARRHTPLPAEQIMHGGGDRAAGNTTQPTRERDRARVEPEFAQLIDTPADRSRVQQHQQHSSGATFDRRQTGNERQRNAGDHQQDRRRGFSTAGRPRDQHQHRPEKQHNLNGAVISPARAPKTFSSSISE